ncbi:hypothetical protein WN944_026913 [Citrus x changshan-huyou]|uniref:Uncharacterized protein n=1 Tax=Citrus x changshan-huyou TaxID=2935761 RepID=A0AAP0LKW4_9ROSI
MEAAKAFKNSHSKNELGATVIFGLFAISWIGMDVDFSLLPATTTVRSSSSSGGCTDILGRSNTPSFSYFKD